MLLYASLALSALAIAAIVYRYDLYEREPWWMILLAITLGAVAMHAIGLIQVQCYLFLGPASTTNPVTISLMAGTSEELAKVFVVALIALLLPRQFNDPLDGLIYGAMAGLGAALDESAAFLRCEAATSLPAAELIRLCGHLIMGGIGSAGLGLALFPPVPPTTALSSRCSPHRLSHWPLIPLTLLSAMLLHTAWDLIAVPANDTGRMSPLRTIYSIALMLAGLAAFAGLTLAAQRRSHTLFAPDDPLSPTRRLRQGRHKP